MVLFWPIQQELDCISNSGQILGKIIFDGDKEEYRFYPNNESLALSGAEQTMINERISGLESGKYIIPMQDDD